MKIKEELYKVCVDFVKAKQQTIDAIISSNKKALESETKSSAGDKHETGRAMLQLEMEKASQQLAVEQQMNETLQKINIEKQSNAACLGSLVSTSMGTYFLAISVGKVEVNNTDYFVISIASPIGKLLLGKSLGDEINFNGKNLQIKQVL